MDIKDLKIFQGLSDSSLLKVKEQSKLLSYRIGQPITEKNKLSKYILIILEGNTRLIGIENNKRITVAKLGAGSIIGLGSFLRLKGCEEVNASDDVKALAIPEELISDLYNTDKSFREYTESTLFPCEILDIAEILINRSNRIDLSLISCFNALVKNAKLNSCPKNSLINNKENTISIIASQSFENYTIGDTVENNSKLINKSIISGRVLEIQKQLLDEFKSSSKQISHPDKNIQITGLDPNNNPEQGPLIPEQSSSDIANNYSKQKSIELIRASGQTRETLACLQMLSKYMELPFRKDSIEKILKDELGRGKKPSITFFGELFSFLGLQANGVKLPTKMASRFPTPCLIPWKDGFAIVENSNSDGFSLLSPKEGKLNINQTILNDLYPDGIEILIVERISTTPNQNFSLSWFLPSLKKYQGSLIQVLIASFVVQLFGLANPLLIQVIIDKVISQRSLDTLQVLGIGLVIVTLLGGVISGLRTFLFTETTNRIDTKLGAEVIDHLLKLPLNYFDKRPVGELGTRIAELEKIRNFLTGQALTTILDGAFSIIYIVVMVIYSWLLTIIALGVVPIQIALTLIGAPLLRRQIRLTANENAKTQSHLVEVLTGIQTVKAQNVETVSRWKWQELYGKYISRTFEKTITGTLLGETSQVLQQLSQLLVLWVGASLVLAGELTLGQLIAFRIISGFVTQPLLRLSSIWQSIQELKVSFERLADIIDTPEESNEADKANIPLPQIKGEVKFENLSFQFKKSPEDVLKNINLTIPSGKFVGIAGQSGSGKSTLMKLLPRLYELERGRILIDEYDVTKVELYSLRRQIGIVPQDPLLFAGSISENIALTNPDINADEIVKAAKIADAHNFIMQLPMGYSSNVGERGSSLSGGQKQRIAIARTLINKPKLLIMDEATSALDYETESIVCENIRTESKGLTVFFITHRLNTIKNADIIVMMHQGNIAEIGSHKELIDKKGRYYALYRQQEAN